MKNVEAFLRVAKMRSFVCASRDLEVAPSVVTKRVTQLEKALGTRLFVRSTRGLTLTGAGERYLPRLALLMAAFDEVFAEPEDELRQFEAHLRILSPPTITSLFLGKLINDYQLQHRYLDVNIVLMDRPANPLAEGYDVAFAAWPNSYPGVLDVPLCPYELVACCAPTYLSGQDRPKHPTELVNHQCLTTMLFKTNWGFQGSQGPINVEVHSRMQSSDMRMVRDAALKGLGITLLPYFLVDEDLMSGALEEVLTDYPVTPFLLKAMVPRMKMNRPAVRSLVKFLQASIAEAAPTVASAR